MQKIKLSFFKGYICRGSKDCKMSKVEMNFVKVEVFKENGQRKYDRDLSKLQILTVWLISLRLRNPAHHCEHTSS